MRSEDQLQAGIIGFLRRALPADHYMTAIPNGSVLAGDIVARAKQARKLKTTGMAPGAPDIIIVVRGMFFGLEVKTTKGRTSPAQRETADKIQAAGALYSIVRSIEETERFLRASGVHLRATVLKEEE